MNGLGDVAMRYCIDNIDFDSVLDIGAGPGRHSRGFREAGKTVTSVDIAPQFDECIQGSYMDIEFPKQDLVWGSHILEHQLNVNNFLTKARRETKDDGMICVTVPPLKHAIVGGHVTLWNAGLVLYNLVLAGYDCRDARIKQSGYNITVIAKAGHFELPPLAYDKGDIETLKPWLPPFAKQGFNGNIKSLNW